MVSELLIKRGETPYMIPLQQNRHGDEAKNYSLSKAGGLSETTKRNAFLPHCLAYKRRPLRKVIYGVKTTGSVVFEQSRKLLMATPPFMQIKNEPQTNLKQV